MLTATILFSLITFLGSLLGLPWLIGRLDSQYFCSLAQDQTNMRQEQLTGLNFLWLVLRNSIGILLFIVGMAMLFLPGQGLLTMLIGLCLLDFPGKKKILLWLLQKKNIQKGLNWIRRKRHKEEFLFPDDVA